MSGVLVPTNGTPISSRAISVGATLAEALRTQLVLLHVIQPKDENAVTDEDISRQKLACRLLQDAANRVAVVHGHMPTLAVVIGIPARRIVDLAARLDSLLIVMATHSHEGTSGATLGKVADAVLASSPVPLALVPALAGDHADAIVERVMVAHDGTRPSRVMVASVSELAQRMGAQVAAYNVCHKNSEQGALDPAHVVQQDEDRPGQILAVAARGGSRLSRAKQSPSAAGIMRTSPVPVLAYGPALLQRLCASDRYIQTIAV